MTAVIARMEGDITKAEVATFADRKAQVRMALTIKDIHHLESIRREIEKIEGVISVERV